jgi:hypothetical protein
MRCSICAILQLTSPQNFEHLRASVISKRSVIFIQELTHPTQHPTQHITINRIQSTASAVISPIHQQIIIIQRINPHSISSIHQQMIQCINPQHPIRYRPRDRTNNTRHDAEQLHQTKCHHKQLAGAPTPLTLTQSRTSKMGLLVTAPPVAVAQLS